MLGPDVVPDVVPEAVPDLALAVVDAGGGYPRPSPMEIPKEVPTVGNWISGVGAISPSDSSAIEA